MPQKTRKTRKDKGIKWYEVCGIKKGPKSAVAAAVAHKKKDSNAISADKIPQLCRCGCGEPCRSHRTRFLQGHDARMYGRVIKIKNKMLTIEDLSSLGVKPYAISFYEECLAEN